MKYTLCDQAHHVSFLIRFYFNEFFFACDCHNKRQISNDHSEKRTTNKQTKYTRKLMEFDNCLEFTIPSSTEDENSAVLLTYPMIEINMLFKSTIKARWKQLHMPINL